MVSMVYQNIVRMRKARKLTQTEVAEQLGVSRPTYISIEKGQRDPSVSELERIAAIFGVSASELLS
ncbi:MAG: helix-turn-helix domain-containing protein, partial [Lactobacillus sp.]|nr:helix-turn-helix domain-containing protein [Lactobacillus sp.]